jgi:hypothetical protein
MLRHAWLGRHTVRRGRTASLDITLIGHRVHRDGGGHIIGRQVVASRHSGSLLLGREVLTGGLFGRLDLIRIVDTVLIAGSRLGGVEACLDNMIHQLARRPRREFDKTRS